jgi:hypothetical protein
MTVQEPLDTFAQLIEGKDLRLRVHPDTFPETRRPAKTDALFHLPLLALCILVITKLEELTTEQTGRRVAHLLIEHFRSLRNLQTLDWSMTLRRRCAEALTFLEAARLIDVHDAEVRRVTLTAGGKQALARGLRDESDVGQLARGLVRAQSRVTSRLGEK